MSQNNLTVSTKTTASQSKKAALPMWAAFAKAVQERIEDEGVELLTDQSTESGLPENKNWVRLEHQQSGNKLYIPKGKGTIRHLETTIELSPDPKRGVLELPKPKSGKPYENGAIRSHLTADPVLAASLFVEAIAAGAVKPAKRTPRTQQAQAASTEAASGRETMTVDQDDVEAAQASQTVSQVTR